MRCVMWNLCMLKRGATVVDTRCEASLRLQVTIIPSATSAASNMGVLALVSYFSSMLSVSVPLSLALIIIASCFYSLQLVSSEGKLKKPPGPRGLPVLGNLLVLGSNPHRSLHALSQRYGGLMFLKLGSKPTIIASSKEAATAILKTFDSDFANRPKNMGATTDILLYNRNDFTMSSESRWPMLRKVCISHLLTPKSLQKWQHFREQEMALLLASIFKQGANRAVDVGDFVNVFASNVIGQMTFSMRLFDDNNSEAAHFRVMMEDFLAEGGGVFGHRIGDFVPFLDWIGLGGSLHRAKSVNNRIDQFLVKKIEQQKRLILSTRDEENDTKDFLQVLYELKSSSAEQGGQLSEANIKGILLNMIAAGTDSATQTVEWAMSELIRHPHLMKKVREEMDSVVGIEENVTESQLPELKYLQAVVTETLRLHPPTPLTIPHGSPESATEIMGHYIPPNSDVMVNVWSIARDPKAWEKPLEFDPDRFVENPVNLDGRDFRIIPFGAGRRSCPGYNLGLRMIHFALASFIHAFHWTLPPGQKPEDLDMDEKYEVTIHRIVPLKLFATPCLPMHVYNSPERADYV